MLNNWCKGDEPCPPLKKQDELLTKAKELIKRLMHELVVSNRPYNEVELLVKDVEQFLNRGGRGMTDRQRHEIKDALLQCAKENENRSYATFHIVVSSICRSAKERIEELEQQVEKMRNCENCDNFVEYATCAPMDGKLRFNESPLQKVKGCRLCGECKDKNLWRIKS